MRIIFLFEPPPTPNTLTQQPGLTKSRDTVTLFNLLKRDQDHVFSKCSCFKAQISGRGANNIIQEL